MCKYYLDTSIWLDLFEERNEPHFPKTDLARELMIKIIETKKPIIFSTINILELKRVGYPTKIVMKNIEPFKELLKFVHVTKEQINVAKAIAKKRKIPKGDVLHAIIARDCGCVLVSHDLDFKKLKDIVEVKTIREIIS